MDFTEIYTTGTKVVIQSNNVEGVITKVAFIGYPMSVIYSVEWWEGLSLNCGDFFSNQIHACQETKTGIGFTKTNI